MRSDKVRMQLRLKLHRIALQRRCGVEFQNIVVMKPMSKILKCDFRNELELSWQTFTCLGRSARNAYVPIQHITLGRTIWLVKQAVRARR